MKIVKSNRWAKKSKKKPVTKETQDPPNIKDILLNGPKFDLIIPKRTRWRRSPPVIFD
jgi:hypothetical protein